MKKLKFRDLTEWLKQFIDPKKIDKLAKEAKVPYSLEECFEHLDRLENGKIREEFLAAKVDDVACYHHGLGRWMRNNWGLWGRENRLCREFAKLGIEHADDMSGIILTSYYRHLHQQPLRIRDQIDVYKEHWKKHDQSLYQKIVDAEATPVSR
jgi:hypothetical protein